MTKEKVWKFKCKSCGEKYEEITPDNEVSCEAECICGVWNYTEKGKIRK